MLSPSSSSTSLILEVQEIPKDGRQSFSPQSLESLTFPYYIRYEPSDESAEEQPPTQNGSQREDDATEREMTNGEAKHEN